MFTVFPEELAVIATEADWHHIEHYESGMGWHLSSYVSQGRRANIFDKIVYFEQLDILKCTCLFFFFKNKTIIDKNLKRTSELQKS